MKILLIIDSLGSGGAQRQIVTLACGLKQRFHDVELFIYHPDNHFRNLLVQSNIVVNENIKKSRLSLGPIWALRKLFKKKQYDIAVSFLDTPNIYAELAVTGLKTKLIVSERSMYPSGKMPIKLYLLQQFHRIADHITANSHHQRKLMVEKFSWMSDKLDTIYNGYDLNEFKPQFKTSFEKNKLNLIAISSVAFKKNPLNLAIAIKICKEFYKLNVYLDWVGAKSVFGDGAKPLEETDAYLKKFKLLNHWRWLGVRTDIKDLLAKHEALIHPSFSEGLPNVVCEALSCGRPVLVSRVCDHPILVQEGVSGYLFDPESPDEMARKIFEFSKLSPQERLKMGEAGRHFAVKNLSVDRYVNEYEKVMRSLI